MSGRRILDAIAIFKATRTVALNHTRLRRQEFDTFKNTSSLISALRESAYPGRTGVGNASVVARPYGGSGTRSLTEARTPVQARTSDRDIKETLSTTANNKGSEQDHFHGILKDENAVASIPSRGSQLKQEREKRNPLPDGIIPSTGNPTVTSNAEADIFPDVRQNVPFKKHTAKTANTASGPNVLGEATSPIEHTTLSSSPSLKQLRHQSVQQATGIPPEPAKEDLSTLETTYKGDELCVDQEKDVYPEPNSQASPVYSSLPRVKVPRHTETSQDDDQYTHGKGINQDVYYTTPQDMTRDVLPETQSVPQQESISGDLYSEIFHSPRVARLLNREDRSHKPREDLHIQGPARSPAQQCKTAITMDQESQYERIPENISVKNPGQGGIADNGTLQHAPDIAEATVGPPCNASKVDLSYPKHPVDADRLTDPP